MVEQAAELGRRLERADDRQAEMSLGVVQHQHAVRRRQRVQAGRAFLVVVVLHNLLDSIGLYGSHR